MGANHDDMHDAPDGHGRALRLGIGGPVGSGKTALVAALCRSLGPSMRLGVVTNDIYTTEDADFLRRAGVIDPERILAVQTGCCPHTAIRDDIAANLDAVETLEERFGPLDLVIVESGGDNLTATFSRGLADRQIFVLDVSGGDKVPRKGGPGVTTADLLVVNKTDLAPMVGADLTVMSRDAAAVRHGKPVLFTSVREDKGAHSVAEWVVGMVGDWRHAYAHPGTHPHGHPHGHPQTQPHPQPDAQTHDVDQHDRDQHEQALPAGPLT